MKSKLSVRLTNTQIIQLVIVRGRRGLSWW